ncbi:hypothetical protein ABBQ32_008286 [Trebouxia sp. C0010 RCD-2024]
MMPSEEDWQEQKDEIMAMASILDQSFSLTGPSTSGNIEDDVAALVAAEPSSQQIQCTAALHVVLPSGKILIQDDTADQGPEAGCTVQHLPPVLMQLELPGNYPSQQAPHLRLSAPWLTHQQLQQLQQHLLGMWSDSPGLPICYTWVDWLQQDSLHHLGLSNAIDLSVFIPQSTLKAPQKGSCAQSCSSHPNGAVNHPSYPTCDPPQTPEEVLITLLQFDVAEKQRAFRGSTWNCGICFEQTPGRQCVQASLQCQHVYCQDCMRQHCTLHVKEGSLEFLRCPVPDCKEPLDRQMMKGLLSAEQNNRLEAVELERTLNHMADAVYCPRCSTISIEDEDNCAQCSKCYFTFCSLCDASWHPGTQCLTPEAKLELMRRRMEGTKTGDAEFRKREAELQNLAHIQKTCKQCPACGMAIERSEGCNKMTCSACGAYFCYKCNQQIEGYKHYWNGGCVLFDLDEIQRWEQQMGQQMMGLPQQDQLQEGFAARQAHGCRCPRCGRLNHKQDNNNNMRCPFCTVNFCYLCKELLMARGSSGKHFGPKKACKQHSAD